LVFKVAQAVSRRPFTVEARIGSQVSLCVFCGAQSGTGTDFFPSSSVSHRSPFQCWKQKEKRAKSGKTSKMQCSFGKLGTVT